MKVLVTGASGFIGRNLVERLENLHEIAAPTRGQLDLLDEDQVTRYLRQNRFDTVVHAATVRASRRLGSPPGLLQQNCRLFFNLVRNQDTFGKLLFLSSGAVYDRRHIVPRIAEECFDRHVPADDYGFSKYICARTIAGSRNLFELRLFGVFGRHEDWAIRFLSNACCRAVWDQHIAIRQNVRFDYLDVADLASIVERFIDRDPRYSSYNVCSGRVFDLMALAQIVIRTSGKKLPILLKRPGLGREYSGDNGRLLDDLPDFRFREIENSVEALYRWYSDCKATIDPNKLDFDA